MRQLSEQAKHEDRCVRSLIHLAFDILTDLASHFDFAIRVDNQLARFVFDDVPETILQKQLLFVSSQAVEDVLQLELRIDILADVLLGVLASVDLPVDEVLEDDGQDVVVEFHFESEGVGLEFAAQAIFFFFLFFLFSFLFALLQAFETIHQIFIQKSFIKMSCLPII